MLNNDDFVKVGIDRILLHHKNSKNFKMISILIRNFERTYFNVIKELSKDEAYGLREKIYTSLQVVHYDSILVSYVLLLKQMKGYIRES